MSIDHSNPTPKELYYECEPCDYSAPAGVAIGLCPHCGERLHEQTVLP